MNFSKLGCPFVIVIKLTKKIIEEVIKAYAEDDIYWLKFYHFAGDIDIDVFNKLQAEKVVKI